MRVLIDTNVIIDVLTRRHPLYGNSAAVLRMCGDQWTGLITASQTTDIFYLLRREKKSAAEAKAIIQKLVDNLTVADVTVADVKNALVSEMDDYEDALLAFCGKRRKADYIITRNDRDFKNSPIKAVTPEWLISSRP